MTSHDPAAPDAAPEPTETVDARGLSCPMPVIELAKAVRDVDVSDVVRVVATDSTAQVDVPVWCRMQRHRLLRASSLTPETGPVEYHFDVQKAHANGTN